jgi:type I restriction enzyme S subunit
MSRKTKTTTTKEEVKPALVPKLRFPAFQNAGEWEVKKLKDIGRVIRGASPRPKGDPRYYGGPVPRLMVQDVTRDGKWVTPQIDSLTEEGARLSRLCPVGTLTIVCSGSVGVVSFLAVDACIHDGFLALVDIDESVAKKDFLFHTLSTLREQFEKGATHGGVFTNLTTTGIDLFEIKRPGVPEQQRIIECLGSVDELIAAQARKVDALKTHKKGLMQQLFPREGETQPRLRFPEFQNAGEWDFKPFEEFVTKSFYGTSSSTAPTGKYPVLRMGNMVDGGLDFTNLVYLDLDPDSFESFRLEDGDILLNRTNSLALVGKISLFRLKSECMTASYIVTYRLNKKRIDPSFCNSMLNTPLYQARIRSFAKPSVSQVNINPTTFKKDLIVSVPSLAEQQRIATCLSSLDALITAETQKHEALKTHKRGLMQQLFPLPEEVAA